MFSLLIQFANIQFANAQIFVTISASCFPVFLVQFNIVSRYSLALLCSITGPILLQHYIAYCMSWHRSPVCFVINGGLVVVWCENWWVGNRLVVDSQQLLIQHLILNYIGETVLRNKRYSDVLIFEQLIKNKNLNFGSLYV